jgi:serine/threonine protein kinase
VAVKTFLTKIKAGRRPDVASVKSELACLQRLQESAHRHVANLLDVHEDAFETHAVLEYCAGGSLQRHLQTRGHGVGLDESVSAALLAQLGSALAHMHDLGVTHRDVKPENVCFDDNQRSTVRFVDFGFAALHRLLAADGGLAAQRRLKTICGSPAYMAPELTRGAAYLGPPVDVWALGCLAFELLHNRQAFRAQSIPEMNVRILKCKHDAFDPALSRRMQGWVKKALDVQVAERVDARTLASLAQSLCG